MQEHDAIMLLKQGDIRGLESLVKTYQVKALRAAYLIVRDHDMADDVVQDSFLRAYERINQFDPNYSFGPWFYRIVINIAKRTAVQHNRHISFNYVSNNEETTLDEIIADLSSGPEALTEKADLQHVVWIALGKLPPNQRAVIVQRYYLDMTGNEIAGNSGVPLGTIKWRFHTAHKHLRSWLSQLLSPDSLN